MENQHKSVPSNRSRRVLW